MASAITHFVVGASLALPAIRSRAIRGVFPGWAIPVTSGLVAVAPDLDTYAMRLFEIPRDSVFSHRGVFHSALFLILICGLLALWVARRSRGAAGWLAVLWAGCAITHPLLDMLTDGGPGVLLLYPFSEARLFFSWRPIHVSPLGVVRFFSRAAYILKSELPFCLGALAAGCAGLAARMGKAR